MPKHNNNLVCTRITDKTKIKLELIKAYYATTDNAQLLSKSDYAALEALINAEHERVLKSLHETK
ncbi:MAG: hypothetical protein EOP45_07745 [Sphingobacteriaceae bacterium]|nr:MAG: hypothetical protein EOP45_07745 [Sphingobacteriaceae bacterium]